MKVLQASIFDSYIERGGSTRHWVVLLSDDGYEVPYVVKLFSDRQIEQGHPVLKEVLGCVLAREFSLKTPEFALAQFSDVFIDFALGEEQQKILDNRSSGLKFASKLLDAAIILSPSLHRAYMKDYDFANVYAFDALKCKRIFQENPDRYLDATGGVLEEPR